MRSDTANRSGKAFQAHATRRWLSSRTAVTPFHETAMHFTKLGFFFAVLLLLALAARLSRSPDDVQVSSHQSTPTANSQAADAPAVVSE